MVWEKRENFSKDNWNQAVTMVDVVRMQVQKQSHRVGFYFLQDQERLELSYGDLDRQARAIAADLQQRNQEGERVLLMYPPGLELIAGIIGCMYAGVIAVPVYPPRRNRNLARLQAIAEDARASSIFTTQDLQESLGVNLTEKFLNHLPIIASDRIALQLADHWQVPQIDGDSIALLQYTSGSTGKPKGVILSHRNLLHNLQQIYESFGHNCDSSVVSWLPPYHDMGLIGGIFQPLYGGFPVTLMAPVSFLQKPLRWLQAISQTGATTSGAPNFAYEMCLNISPEACENLDLSCWELAFTGAEPIRADTLEKFAIAFAPYGFKKSAFYACYGLAEATLFVTGGYKGKEPTLKNFMTKNTISPHQRNYPKSTLKTIVSCGYPWGEQRVIIINPDTHTKCADGEEGEIWISGESVACGYWNRPQETANTFQAVCASTDGEKFLRTGDLGIWQDGELFVTGRIKDIIVIRGRNYYPQDIEAVVAQCHPSLSKTWGAACGIELDGEEKLIIVQEVERNSWRNLDPNQINLAIRAAVSQEFELQVYGICLLKPGSIPKTSSGKVQRYACKAGFIHHNLEAIYRWQLEANIISPQNNQSSKKAEFNPLENSLRHQESSQTSPTVRLGILTDSTDRNVNCGNISPSPSDNLISWLRDYATHHINSQLIDERRCIPPHIVLDFGNQGLLGMQVPPSYGGLGLGHEDTLRILQQLGAIDTTLALFVGLNNVLGIRPILLSASAKIQAELLPILATGRELAAFALTEPTAGANPQAIASLAIPTATGWKLQGEKIWSGSAAWSGVINVFAREPQRGISGFVVRRGTPGLRQGGEALTMGMRGMVQNTVYLQDVPVTPEQVLGTIGRGMDVAQDAMMYGRLAIAAACVGGMKRCVQLIWRYGSRRKIATGKLGEHPVVLRNLDELLHGITAIESLVTSMAKILDQGLNLPREIYAACKITAPELYWQAADVLIQTLGGRGYIETNIAPQILRDARVLRIFEGPTETLCGFLGARVYKQGEALTSFLTQVWGAGEISRKLENAIAQIQGRFADGFGNSSHNFSIERLIHHQLGELASDGILWGAMVANVHQVNPAALNWIENRFNSKLAHILNWTPDNLPFANLQTVSFLVEQYNHDIGDIEQESPGEERELDVLLRKSIHPISTDKSNHSPIAVSEKDVVPDNPEENILELENKSNIKYQQIQSWLMNWLSHKLHIPAGEISPSRAFADYGMDSVTAVELAQDLQEMLTETLSISQPLDATIAWNFPTIEQLASYLSQDGQINAAVAGTSTEKSSNTTTESTANSLEELSTAEMAVLLAQEIDIAKQRKKL